jgi:hypothetical protein
LTHTHNPIKFLMFLPIDVQQLDNIEWSRNDSGEVLTDPRFGGFECNGDVSAPG